MDFRPEDLAAMARAQQLFGQRVGGLESLAEQLQAQAMQPVAQLPGITIPQAPTELDPLSQQLISQGLGIQKAQTGRAQADLMQQFASNPAIAQILGAQLGAQSQLAGNVLPLQAMQQQVQRTLPMQQLQLAAEQAQLGRGLSQEQLEAARRAEALGFGQAGLGARGQQLGLLAELARLRGEQVSRQEQETKETGGLLGGLMSIFG
jgi:hypothetical protein